MSSRNRKNTSSQKKARNSLVSSRRRQHTPKGRYGDDWCPSPYNYIALKEYRVKRCCDLTNLAQVAASDTLGVIGFSLDQTDGYTDFTALFDEYRIDFVTVTFNPMFNAQPLGPATLLQSVLCTIIDYDDSVAPTATSMRQFATYKETQGAKVHVRSIKPRIADVILNTGGALTAQRSSTGFVDMGYPQVPHFGLKYNARGGAAAQTSLQIWSIVVEYYMTMRSTR